MGYYRFCFSARFVRHRARLITSASRNGALAANSACRITSGKALPAARHEMCAPPHRKLISSVQFYTDSYC
jgi:hypothetical protein